MYFSLVSHLSSLFCFCLLMLRQSMIAQLVLCNFSYFIAKETGYVNVCILIFFLHVARAVPHLTKNEKTNAVHLCTKTHSWVIYTQLLGKPMQVFLIIQAKLQLPDTHTVQCHSVSQPLVSVRGWAISLCQPHKTGWDWACVAWHDIWRHPPQHQLPPGTVPLCPLMPTLFPPDVLGAPTAPGSVTQRRGLSVGRAPPQRRGCVRRTVARLH